MFMSEILSAFYFVGKGEQELKFGIHFVFLALSVS